MRHETQLLLQKARLLILQYVDQSQLGSIHLPRRPWERVGKSDLEVVMLSIRWNTAFHRSKSVLINSEERERIADAKKVFQLLKRCVSTYRKLIPFVTLRLSTLRWKRMIKQPPFATQLDTSGAPERLKPRSTSNNMCWDHRPFALRFWLGRQAAQRLLCFLRPSRRHPGTRLDCTDLSEKLSE
ncbi:hypothetical protein KC338_g69 [Hortaea werneckii]|nr:hypothetical protein KC338_g69 [Hortaea werneckii]